jgi:hypothetical protein
MIRYGDREGPLTHQDVDVYFAAVDGMTEHKDTLTLSVKLPEDLVCRIRGGAKLLGLKVNEMLVPILIDAFRHLEPFQRECRKEFKWMLDKKTGVDELERMAELSDDRQG